MKSYGENNFFYWGRFQYKNSPVTRGRGLFDGEGLIKLLQRYGRGLLEGAAYLRGELIKFLKVWEGGGVI